MSPLQILLLILFLACLAVPGLTMKWWGTDGFGGDL